MTKAKRSRLKAESPPMVTAGPLNAAENDILILAPSGNDARLTAEFLFKSGLKARLCRGISEVCARVTEGCGSILLAEETLGQGSISALVEALDRQPAWSDIPITIITSGGETSQMQLRRLGVFGPGGNVSLLERPFRPGTLISMVDVALRGRRRQYEARELMRELHESEARIRQIVSLMPTGMYACDGEGRITFFNRRAAEMWGSEPKLNDERERFCPCFKVFLPDGTFVPPHERAMAVCLREGSSFDLEAMVERPDGSRFTATFNVEAVWDATGRLNGAICVFYDISQRKLGDAAVRESERRYSQLVHSLPAAVYTTDTEGRLLLYNEAAAVLWGRRPEIGKELWCGSYRIYRPDGTPLPLDRCPMAVTLREGRPVRGEEILVERPDGTRRNVLPYPDPIRDVTGKVTGAVNMLLDVTDSRGAEQASRRLAAIVESSDDAIISKDLNGRVTSWNRGAFRLFGYTAEETIGQSITILMPPERIDEEPGILQRIRRGERVEHYETIRRRKNGTLVEVELSISPIKDGNGAILGASKIVRDISHSKRAARELELAHKEVLASSRLKDDFLATLSHELRTPLNPVLLVAGEAANNPGLSPAIRADFKMIRKNVELESRLIDDLLDLTRISRGKISIEKCAVDIHAVLHDAIAIVEGDLLQKQIVLKIDCGAERHHVLGDGVRLQQIFWNLLKNAVKFTPVGGRIAVESRCEPKRNEIVVEVCDNGIGMTGGELGRVFEAFSQGDHASGDCPHRFGGLGLGLAISRMLVALHSGTITAGSQGRDQGATFTVTLPLAPRGMDLNQPGEGISPAGDVYAADSAGATRVLLVEDHEPTRTALSRLLTRRGYKVKTAGSFAEARAVADARHFQLLISDIGLPDGNGFELMRELRAGNKDIRGIALTGYGTDQDVERSLEAGFDIHLTKPVRVQSLETALAAIRASKCAVDDHDGAPNAVPRAERL